MSLGEFIVILGLVALVLGAKRLGAFGKSIKLGVRGFQQGLHEDPDDTHGPRRGDIVVKDITKPDHKG